jgi:hypothetical protein
MADWGFPRHYMLNPIVYLFPHTGILWSHPGLSPPRMMMQATAVFFL